MPRTIVSKSNVSEVTPEEKAGAQMIIDLQKAGGITEPMERAIAGWRSMSPAERANTKAAYEVVCAPQQKKAAKIAHHHECGCRHHH